MLYSGSEGSLEGLAEIRKRGMGIMVTASGWRPPRPDIPWALDNGAYSSWTQGLQFDVRRFERVLRKVPSDHRPDFAVVPDIVAGGIESLTFSLSCLKWLPHGWPWYLAVQDGMNAESVSPVSNEFGGIFVGGTMEWKLKTGESWVKFAHARGMKCHIGRAGTIEKLVWARRIEADSVDTMSWARNETYHYIDEANKQTILEAVSQPQ